MHRTIVVTLSVLLSACIALPTSHSCVIKVGPRADEAKVREQLLGMTPLGMSYDSVLECVKKEQQCKGLKKIGVLPIDGGVLKVMNNPSGRGSLNLFIGDKGFIVFFGIYRWGFGLVSYEITAKYAFKNGKLIDIIPTVANPGGDF